MKMPSRKKLLASLGAMALIVIVSISAFNPRANVDAQGIGIGIGGNQGAGNQAGVPLVLGDVSGFAWMAQNIDDTGPDGGGGWLNFNCKTSYCQDFDSDGTIEPNEAWGTKIRLVHDVNYGLFSGQAWSSNYGWLSFQTSDVETCWEDNQHPVQSGVARAMLNDTGPWVNVVGWGRFISGADDPNDGYDGCVSFNGANHGVQLNLSTGLLRGWAWGGPVVGWVSFANPECPQCNTSVNMPGTSFTFWAEDTLLAPGDTNTVLRWQANNQAPNYVAECLTYSNTSNYSHWRWNIASPANVGPINTGNGKLPSGSHPVNGIQQTTTYSLTCRDRFGVTLPTQYTTVNVGGLCTDPNANNAGQSLPCEYDSGMCTDPAANNVGEELPCTYDEEPADIDLSLIATPATLTIGSGNYMVDLAWSTSPPNELDSCVGTATFEGSSINLSSFGWDNVLPYLSDPNSSLSNIDLSTWASTASVGDQFVFTISCNNDGANVIAQDVVNMIDPIISSEPPLVDLFITAPDIDPVGESREDIHPVAGTPLMTLRWSALNVTSCQAISAMYLNGANDGPNTQWNGQSLADDDQFNNTEDITNLTDPAFIKNTIFRISCIAEDTATYGSAPITADVCLGLTGIEFPECTAGGVDVPPRYEEI